MLWKIIIIINVLSFIIMGLDKWQARKQRRRVPEKTLFLLALILGAGGILLGMYIFRHKTKHLSFKIGIPVILIINIISIIYVFYQN